MIVRRFSLTNQVLKHLTLACISFMLLSCNVPKLNIEVAASDPNIDLTDVTRYRVIIRQLTDTYPALAQDYPAGTTFDIDTAVIPGEEFYVLIQAWKGCENPPNICPDDILAADNECRCVNANPKFQRIVAEGCTPWLSLTKGEDTLSISLSEPSNACPPSL